MRLWVLLPVNPIAEPWDPWYDRYTKMFGCIVVAESETQARRLASERSGREGDQAWLTADLSSCRELIADEPGVIMCDYRRD